MKKNIFFSKKINSIYLFSFFFFIILIVIYFFSFYIQIKKPFFIISTLNDDYYIIPKDKEGEKVKFLEKKSINNFSNLHINNLDNIDNVEFTIQLFSDENLDVVEKYKKKFINLKNELIDISNLYLFKIETDIGINYFLSYKNFSSKEEALNFCNINSFLNECLIIYLKNE